MPRLTETQIDDLVDAWHDGTGKQKLHEFLEWCFEDYCLWVQTLTHIPLMSDESYQRVLNKL